MMARRRRFASSFANSCPPFQPTISGRAMARCSNSTPQAILLARKAYAELEAGGPVIDGKASPWLVVLEKAHRSAVALSGRLRLAPQARADSRSAGRNKGAPPSVYDQMRNENYG